MSRQNRNILPILGGSLFLIYLLTGLQALLIGAIGVDYFGLWDHGLLTIVAGVVIFLVTSFAIKLIPFGTLIAVAVIFYYTYVVWDVNIVLSLLIACPGLLLIPMTYYFDWG